MSNKNEETVVSNEELAANLDYLAALFGMPSRLNWTEEERAAWWAADKFMKEFYAARAELRGSRRMTSVYWAEDMKLCEEYLARAVAEGIDAVGTMEAHLASSETQYKQKVEWEAWKAKKLIEDKKTVEGIAEILVDEIDLATDEHGWTSCNYKSEGDEETSIGVDGSIDVLALAKRLVELGVIVVNAD